jgi:hypothetical protein
MERLKSNMRLLGDTIELLFEEEIAEESTQKEEKG